MTRRVPQADLQALMAHFSAGRTAAMEALAAALVERYPDDGQAWKAWGVALLVQGKDALSALRRALQLMPGDADVAANLGSLLCARGELDQAADCLQLAVRLNPAAAQAHSNLGDVLVRQGQWQAAEASCRQALTLQPRLAEAQLNLGNALKGQGRIDDAVARYRQAVALKPGLAEAHHALGLALKEAGQLDLAAASLRQALQIRPHHAPSHDQLGLVLHAAGQRDAALACLQQAIELQPGLVSAHFHRAQLLSDLGRADEAVASYRRAIELQPAQAELHVNLGAELLAARRPDEAVAALVQAVQLQPGLAEAHGNLGNAWLALGDFGQALASHRRAVDLAPGWALAQRNLAHVLQTIGQPAAALEALLQARALDPDDPALHSEVLFVRNYLPSTGSAQGPALDEARAFGALTDRLARLAGPQANVPHDFPVAKRLRIGLVSADLRQHPVGYFIESVLAALATRAAGRLDLLVYDNNAEPDALTQCLQAHCAVWRPVARLDDESLSATIRADGVDILIDLAGHTRRNRLPLLAWRPAPLQLSWLGYCATTGMASAVDAFIADPWIVPVGAEHAFCEPVVRLPETFLCFTPPTFDIAVGPSPAAADAGLRFACFQPLAKINDEVVSAWSRILRSLPGSRLMLQARPLNDATVQRQLLDQFAARGVDADRLLLRPAQDRAGYLAAYREVDIALDPFPYPGGTTSVEALWMGVPVLTLAGDRALSRQGVSILRNVGLDDWIATDVDDYVAKAARHVADLQALAGLRQTLRDRLLRSPLCDAARFADHFEALLRRLWVERCARAAAADCGH